MKISICIPQYNRIQYLIKNLRILEKLNYPDVEVIVSDDASTDSTEAEMLKLTSNYRFPIKYKRIPSNVGYDANLRSSLEMASGEYCFILGNDDTLEDPECLKPLVDFLVNNGKPEIGFCNYVEAHSPEKVITRADKTAVIGSGEAIALKYYRSFSYVAGIIVKRSTFEQYNTSKVDGSVYVQMYLAALIISKGGKLFMYEQPLVTKDIQIDGSMANSYRDTLMRSWADYKPIDGGLKQVMAAVLEAFRDAGIETGPITYKVMDNIYKYTYPFWLLDYRTNGSYIGAYALTQGLKPSGVSAFSSLGAWQKLKIRLRYWSSSLIGMLMPVFIFNALKRKVYKFIKK